MKIYLITAFVVVIAVIFNNWPEDQYDYEITANDETWISDYCYIGNKIYFNDENGDRITILGDAKVLRRTKCPE